MNRYSTTRIPATVVIFASAYIPLFLILVIKDFEVTPSWHLVNPLKSGFLIAISFISGLLLWYIVDKIRIGGHPAQILSVTSKSGEIINYTIPYMISFFGFDLSKSKDIIIFSIFLFLLCLLSVRSQSVFINPILAIFGYGLYECEILENGIEKRFMAISRKDMKKGEQFKFNKLTNYLIFVAD